MIVEDDLYFGISSESKIILIKKTSNKIGKIKNNPVRDQPPVSYTRKKKH